MGNKIQILLDIDDFFSILFKKTQIFYFWKKLSIKNGVDQYNPPPPEKNMAPMYATESTPLHIWQGRCEQLFFNFLTF
jgi:hypothetical protein